jgi:hypothetical protein
VRAPQQRLPPTCRVAPKNSSTFRARHNDPFFLLMVKMTNSSNPSVVVPRRKRFIALTPS